LAVLFITCCKRAQLFPQGNNFRYSRHRSRLVQIVPMQIFAIFNRTF